jgi:hypothetical protein
VKVDVADAAEAIATADVATMVAEVVINHTKEDALTHPLFYFIYHKKFHSRFMSSPLLIDVRHTNHSPFKSQ